jgi:hypothetical protein
MFVKPVTGRTIPDPDRGDVLPVEGREVVDNQYWFRRVQDGDVFESVDPIIPKEVK